MLIILSVIIVILSLSALLCGFLKGDMTAVSVASLEGCNKAVELVIYLSGLMTLTIGYATDTASIPVMTVTISPIPRE